MAKQKKSHKGIVPVASRERKSEKKSASRASFSLGAAGFITLGIVTLIILGAVALPLRNYYQQRSEIAHYEALIDEKEKEIDRLEKNVKKYHSDAYIKEEARRRLGVIDKGETAFRIIDPSMDDHPVTPTDETPQKAPATWYGDLWDSVTLPPQ